MQPTADSSSPQLWAVLLSGAVAICVAIITNLDRIPRAVAKWRRRREAARHEDVKGEKLLAQVETIRLENYKTASEFMLVWMRKVEEASEVIQKLREELEERDKVLDEMTNLRDQIELLQTQNRDMKAILEIKGINVGETLDEIKRMK